MTRYRVLVLQAVELVNGQETDEKITMSILVVIRDRNDEPPRFNQNSYQITIDEGLQRDTQIPNLDMVVSDADLVSTSYWNLVRLRGHPKVTNSSFTVVCNKLGLRMSRL